MLIKTIDLEDELSGVERWPQSEAFGELVCPAIILWKSPGVVEPKNVAGALPHGASVRVTKTTTKAGLEWAYVEESTAKQAGWCRLTFLNKLGEKAAKTRYG